MRTNFFNLKWRKVRLCEVSCGQVAPVEARDKVVQHGVGAVGVVWITFIAMLYGECIYCLFIHWFSS